MVRLHKAYILPHLEYCGPLLLNSHLNLTQSQSLYLRRQFQSLVILYRCLHGNGIEYVNELFKIKYVDYNLHGTGTCLQEPSFNLQAFQKSFSFTAKLWNTIPVTVRESQDITIFKCALCVYMSKQG